MCVNQQKSGCKQAPQGAAGRNWLDLLILVTEDFRCLVQSPRQVISLDELETPQRLPARAVRPRAARPCACFPHPSLPPRAWPTWVSTPAKMRMRVDLPARGGKGLRGGQGGKTAEQRMASPGRVGVGGGERHRHSPSRVETGSVPSTHRPGSLVPAPGAPKSLTPLPTRPVGAQHSDLGPQVHAQGHALEQLAAAGGDLRRGHGGGRRSRGLGRYRTRST